MTDVIKCFDGVHTKHPNSVSSANFELDGMSVYIYIYNIYIYLPYFHVLESTQEAFMDSTEYSHLGDQESSCASSNENNGCTRFGNGCQWRIKGYRFEDEERKLDTHATYVVNS